MDEWDLGHESAQRLMVHCYKGWNLLLYCMSMTLRYLKTNKAQVSQNKEVHMQCSCFIPLLHCFTFVSGNEIADLNCHIIAVCIFICFSHPRLLPKTNMADWWHNVNWSRGENQVNILNLYGEYLKTVLVMLSSCTMSQYCTVSHAATEPSAAATSL